MFEVGQLRGALRLATPDLGGALRERRILAAAPAASADVTSDAVEASETSPLYSARHLAWVQVLHCSAVTYKYELLHDIGRLRLWRLRAAAPAVSACTRLGCIEQNAAAARTAGL